MVQILQYPVQKVLLMTRKVKVVVRLVLLASTAHHQLWTTLCTAVQVDMSVLKGLDMKTSFPVHPEHSIPLL